LQTALVYPIKLVNYKWESVSPIVSSVWVGDS